MATKASTLLRLARKASLASRAAAASASRAAAASRDAAMASRSARAAVEAADADRAAWLCSVVSRIRRDDALSRRLVCAADYAHVPDQIPTDKDLESDEALRSFYERWCKAFNKERDQRGRIEMDIRFKLFRYTAESIHRSNTCLPADPERELGALGAFADGGDPYLDEFDMRRLKEIEREEASLGKSQTLNEMN